MTDRGNVMELPDALEYMKGQRITRIQFMTLFAAEEAARTNGKANGKKHPQGAWVEEESRDVTINTMFCDGPPCLWTIAHEGSRNMQNNFLTNVSTFLLRKYPENWDKALEWVNYNILKPVGDREKLADLIGRLKKRPREYDYMCKEEPIVSKCFSYACRKMQYGVGATGADTIDFYDMGMTIINRVPRLFFVNVGAVRMKLDHVKVINQNKFREECVANGLPLQARRKNEEWDRIINLNIEAATIVEPSQIMRTNAVELEFLTQWLTYLVPDYMRMGDKGSEDPVRVNEEEKRIYFKYKKLMRYCRSQNFDENAMRGYIDANCKYHKEEAGSGVRAWFRWTYSAPFDMFDPEDLDKWLTVEQPQ
jgi:hypothetical protein